jgi:hypothetical protein
MIRARVFAITIVALAVTSFARVALAEDAAYVRGDGALSLGAGLLLRDSNALARTFALGFAGGYRWGRVSLFGQLEGNFWRSLKLDHTEEVVMATNVGVGADVLSAEGLVRSSLALGPSILTIPTSIDKRWSVGFFVDLRPVGLRFAIADRWVLGVDPITLALVLPELDNIPLVELQFRTAAYVEWRP